MSTSGTLEISDCHLQSMVTFLIKIKLKTLYYSKSLLAYYGIILPYASASATILMDTKVQHNRPKYQQHGGAVMYFRVGADRSLELWRQNIPRTSAAGVYCRKSNVVSLAVLRTQYQHHEMLDSCSPYGFRFTKLYISNYAVCNKPHFSGLEIRCTTADITNSPIMSLPMSASKIDLNNTMGAVFIGVVIAAMFVYIPIY